MAENFDLFGEPIREVETRRGRPCHEATSQNRNRVNMLLAFGWSNERIAAALRITLPTFRKHYFSELRFREVARDRLDMRRAELLWQQVEAGNVGAMKEFARFIEKNDLMETERKMGQAPRPSAPVEKPGKKVIAEQRAVVADADLMAELDAEASNARLHS